eukprot:1862416-Rhodomonas_salina.2
MGSSSRSVGQYQRWHSAREVIGFLRNQMQFSAVPAQSVGGTQLNAHLVAALARHPLALAPERDLRHTRAQYRHTRAQYRTSRASTALRFPYAIAVPHFVCHTPFKVPHCVCHTRSQYPSFPPPFFPRMLSQHRTLPTIRYLNGGI